MQTVHKYMKQRDAATDPGYLQFSPHALHLSSLPVIRRVHADDMQRPIGYTAAGSRGRRHLGCWPQAADNHGACDLAQDVGTWWGYRDPTVIVGWDGVAFACS